MGKNITIALLVVLLLGTNAYQWIDRSITQDYDDQTFYILQRTSDHQAKALEMFVVGLPVEELQTMLAERIKDESSFIKEGHLHHGGVSFKLDASGQEVQSVGWDPET